MPPRRCRRARPERRTSARSPSRRPLPDRDRVEGARAAAIAASSRSWRSAVIAAMIASLLAK